MPPKKVQKTCDGQSVGSGSAAKVAAPVDLSAFIQGSAAEVAAPVDLSAFIQGSAAEVTADVDLSAIPAINPFFEEFAQKSSSPSGGSQDFEEYFARNASDGSAVDPKQEGLDDGVCCQLFKCHGLYRDTGTFAPCARRITAHSVRHARGEVCLMHHDFVKCVSDACRSYIHVGCYLQVSNGHSIIHRAFQWKCQKCTLTPKVECQKCTLTPKVEPESAPPNDVTGEAAAIVLLPSKNSKAQIVSKSIFESRQHLMQHARDHGWMCRSSARGCSRCYFVCQKTKEGCAVTFCAKAQDAHDDNGQWCAMNMPAQHDCCKSILKSEPTALTTRTCHLPIDVYKEIQRLACCKAFNSASIQTFIRMAHSLTVDTSLIYNIGYRARSKLGVGDIGLLLAQQSVRVYTSPSFCALT